MNWFETWFDSPYYPILYKHRDDQEAESFLRHLLGVLSLPTQGRVLDVACGRGRYSRFLAEQGFDVTGIDLSLHSILFARSFERDNLSFFQHDMRKLFRTNYFDLVLNVFTSFGYFESYKENLDSLRVARKSLKTGGVFVLDFFNAQWVEASLPQQNEYEIDDVVFSTRKYRENGRVMKDIHIEDGGTTHFFQESVLLYDHPTILAMLDEAGFELLNTYGNYDLDGFDPIESPRLICIATPKT